MSVEQRIRDAESELFRTLGVTVTESLLELPRTGLRLRCLQHGSGEPVLLIHGVTMCAAQWAPLFPALADFRLLAIDLPGHGLSAPFTYQRGRVRDHVRDLIDDVLDALGLEHVPVIANSLGAMFALWYALDRDRIASLVSMSDPAVALPGARIRMPLALVSVRGLGEAMLRGPSTRGFYRKLLVGGVGPTDAAAAPPPLLDALRYAAGRPGNARTVVSLMRAITRFRRPWPECVLTPAELERLRVPTLFVWGEEDPYLSPEAARPAIARMPAAALEVVRGGHAPWMSDPVGIGDRVRGHLHVPTGQPR